MDYDENIYRINLKNAITASDLIYDLSMSLEKEEVRNKKVFLQLNDIDLSVAQLKSIRSLINSINSSLSFISTNSAVTKASAVELGIVISDEDTNLSAKLEPEKTYKTVEEIIEEKNEAIEEKREAEEEKQPIISIETDNFTHQDAQNALESIFTENPVPQEEQAFQNVENYNEGQSDGNYNAEQHVENYNEGQPDGNYNAEQHVENYNEGQSDGNYNAEQHVENYNEGQPEENYNDNYNENNNNEQSFSEGNNYEPPPQEIIDSLDSIFESDKKIEDILNVKPQEEGVAPDIEYYKNLDNEVTQEDLEIDSLTTMYVKNTLRSGQVINYDGNVVIIGDCHTGSEVHATGDITVWGVLNGIAHAGSTGNTRAKIRALKMNAIQLRIADSYARKPDALNSVLVEKTNVFTPEEARCIDGDIIIFKIND